LSEVAISPKLTQIFREQLRIKELLVTPDMTQDDVAGWDSTAMVGIVMAIEEEFQFEFTPGELKGLRTAGDLAQLIERHQSGAAH